MADIPAERRLSGETIYSAPGYTDERLHAVLATGLERAAGALPDDDELIELELVAPASASAPVPVSARSLRLRERFAPIL